MNIKLEWRSNATTLYWVGQSFFAQAESEPSWLRANVGRFRIDSARDCIDSARKFIVVKVTL